MVFRTLTISLFLSICISTGRCADTFTIYAPNHYDNGLLVVSASEVDGKLELAAAKSVDLGFPGAAITRHPTQPLLYVVAARQGPGAVIMLDATGGYVNHQRVHFDHGYSYVSTDRAARFLLGVNYREGQVDVFPLDAKGIPGERVAGLDEGEVTPIVSYRPRIIGSPIFLTSKTTTRFTNTPSKARQVN